MKSRYKRVQIDGRSVGEHRFVMEQYLGRKLLPTEQVHHINGDRFDNRIENLEVVTAAEHNKIHHQKYPLTKICAVCGKEFEPHPTKRNRAMVCSPECKRELDKAHAAKRKKPINQYDLNGGFIRTWDSARDIQNETGFFESNISKCCNHKIKSCYGFRWEYGQ